MSIETLSTAVPVVASRNQGSALPNRSASQDSQPQPVQQSRTEEAGDQQLAQAEARRIERVEQAADTFVVSDQRFTIFKDTTGQLITRFTSLRDGTVTYVPESNLLAGLDSRQNVDPSLSFDV